ncbi:hypothetical protein ACVGWG_00310, partial [Enterobacter asburiae]
AASAFDHQDRLIAGSAWRPPVQTTRLAAVLNINHQSPRFSLTRHKKHNHKKQQKHPVAHGK